jgi:hypothetical protein
MNELNQSVDEQTTASAAVCSLHLSNASVSDYHPGHVELFHGADLAVYSPPTGWEI